MTMQTDKKILSFLILPALTFLLAGCPAVKKSADTTLKADSAKYNSALMSKRFQDTAANSQTAVDSAIELAKKHAILVEEASVLRQENQELTAENRRIKDRIAVLEPELKQAKKELNEANDLLIEMRIELNNWKTDILGFRNEMRDAYTAQMEILLKIAQAMGAEVTSEQENNKQSTETSTTGKPNE